MKMITCITSGKFSIFIILLTIFFIQDVKLQRDPIDQYPGIPFITYPSRRVPDILPENYDQMMQMGLYGVVASDLLNDDAYIDSFTTHSLKVLPKYDWGVTSNNQNVIERYTNSHYTIWEAEGTSLANGNATLYMGDDIILSQDGQSIVAEGSNVPYGETIIYGPGYPQNKTYNYPEADTKVQYIAEYRMKIEPINSLPPDYMNNIVCILRVTNSNNDGSGLETVSERNIKVSDFNNGWDNWDTLVVNYEFTLSSTIEELLIQSSTLLPKETAQCVQLKVIWGGLSYLNLYVDKITVSDFKGRQLINTSGPSLDIATFVENKISSHTIVGWYGTDEPFSIDNYEPYRVVDHIIDSISNLPQYNFPIRLHAGMTGFKYGGKGDPDVDYIMAQNFYVLEEFWKRAKPKNIQINCYHYFYPWGPNNYPDSNYVEKDIDFAINSYLDRVNDYDSSFEYSIQTGAYYTYSDTNNPCLKKGTFLDYPTYQQIEYDVNLGLLYGARELRGDPYFSAPVLRCNNEFATAGLIDKNNATTENYDLFKNTIIPRLDGWFGKTLRRLHQIEQFPNINAAHYPDNSTPQEFVDHIEAPCYPPSICRIDYGFFQNQLNTAEKYFMIVNRYYSILNHFNIGLRYLTGYNNWNVTDFIDTTNFTIIPLEGEAEFSYDIYPGDARLFKVYPVIRDGGSLDTSETISNAETLMNDMTIENGVTLTVNAIYNCYANIYVKGSGKIVTTNGGTINFYNGKGIIVEGSPQIYGTSSYKLTLDFGSETEGTGIQVLQGADFKLEYCILKNAANLVFCDMSQHQTSISHCDFQNTSSYAISLSGSSIHVPSINYCTFTNTDYGIFSAGQSSITISYNTFTDNKTAISLSQIPSAQILINSITSDLKEGPGILLSSCSAGTARGNIISGHTNGISLGNSSPLIGANTIEDNKINGIYAGPGSTPDLRGSLAGSPPNQYPISGYNIIWNNGGYTTIGSGEINDDGSEIFLDGSGSVLLDYGCNYIADDRTITLPLLTKLYLINGSSGKRLNARSNAWGDTVYAGRFGRLTLVYNPHNDTVCPILSGQGFLVIQDNDGNAIDTVYSSGEPNYTISPLDFSYSEAVEDMINRDYSSADNIFNSIITSSPGDSSSLNAYLSLYKSKRLQNADSTTSAELRELYNSNLPQISDSVMMKVVSQLSLLTLVDEKQYNEAMLGFYDIINQNPESDEALFAEIDAMTTSLLAQNGNDTTLGKSLYKGLLVKSSKDMQMRMNELIKSRFGSEENKSAKEIIPTKYSLYNNYPNPFNPTTTIRFDIPEITNVELNVYNILGQKVKTLIANETRLPGRYEISFSGSSLASGVYIYRLTTQNFSQSKKMLLIK